MHYITENREHRNNDNLKLLVSQIICNVSYTYIKYMTDLQRRQVQYLQQHMDAMGTTKKTHFTSNRFLHQQL